MAEENKGCFNTWLQGFTTIITLGISCYSRVQTYKKALANAAEITGTMENFNNNVVPLVEKLDGLIGVSNQLLSEAFDKVEVVREFEEVVKNMKSKFEARQGNDRVLKYPRLRKQMVNDLNILIEQCDKTIENSKRRSNDYKNILIDVDSKLRTPNGLQLLII